MADGLAKLARKEKRERAKKAKKEREDYIMKERMVRAQFTESCGGQRSLPNE